MIKYDITWIKKYELNINIVTSTFDLYTCLCFIQFKYIGVSYLVSVSERKYDGVCHKLILLRVLFSAYTQV